MPQVIITSSDYLLGDSGTVSGVLVHMVPVVPKAEEMHALVVSSANSVELTYTEMRDVEQQYKEAAAEEKKSGKSLRNGVLGLVGFIESVWPEMNKRLPILSKFDLATSHVVADEMAALVDVDPELRKLAFGLRSLKERHLRNAIEARQLKRRREQSKVAYRGAQLDLRNRLNEARKFILNSSTAEADFSEMLKQATKNKAASRRKPAQAEVAVSLPASDAAPANDTAAANQVA